jgi:hypothetical protein
LDFLGTPLLLIILPWIPSEIRFLIVTSVLKLGHRNDLKGATSYKLKPSPFCLTPLDPAGLRSDFSLARYLTILHDIHMERPEVLKYIQVVSLSFVQELQSVEKKLALPLPDRHKTLLYKYKLHIKKDGLQKLYFPIHVSENHWIVEMVNFKKKSIAFGEN